MATSYSDWLFEEADKCEAYGNFETADRFKEIAEILVANEKQIDEQRQELEEFRTALKYWVGKITPKPS